MIRAGHMDGNLSTGKPVTMDTDLTPLADWFGSTDKPILLFCVGAPRANGDCYGPVLGSLLRGHVNRHRVSIMGTMEKPIHALNLTKKIAEAKRRYSNHVVVAIDAAATRGKVGQIAFGEGMLVPGAGCGKLLDPVGDYYLMAGTFKDLGDRTANLLAACFAADREFCRSLAVRTAEAILDGLRRRRNRRAQSRQSAVVIA